MARSRGTRGPTVVEFIGTLETARWLRGSAAETGVVDVVDCAVNGYKAARCVVKFRWEKIT